MKSLAPITGVTVMILVVVGFVMVYVTVGPGFTADQRTMVIQGALGALGVLGGYYFASSASADKPRPPGTTTTTTAPPDGGVTTTSTETKA